MFAPSGRRLRRPARRENEGAAAVEMALILPLLVVIVFGIIEFGIAYNRQQSFEAAAREAGRLLSVGYDIDEARDVALDQILTVNRDDVDVNLLRSCPTPSVAGDLEILEVEVLIARNVDNYAIRIPFIAGSAPDYQATAAFRCES